MIKEPLQIIDTLSPTDALAILRALAGSDDQLAARIAEMAMAHLHSVDPEEVAAALYDELNGEPHEPRPRMNSRPDTGNAFKRVIRTRYSYIELTWQVVARSIAAWYWCSIVLSANRA